ncbi:MAG: hypothetical protein ACFB9N_11350 [Geitlerinemataceae cyanobacterium]
MTSLKPPVGNYHAKRVQRLKDEEYAALALETALECADEDGCTDSFRYTIGDIIEALGVEKTRELLEPIAIGRPEHKAQMLEHLEAATEAQPPRSSANTTF